MQSFYLDFFVTGGFGFGLELDNLCDNMWIQKQLQRVFSVWHLRTCILFQTNAADSLILLFRTVLTNSSLWALAAQYRVCILLWRIALSRRPGFKGVPSSSNYNNISICVDDGLNFLQTHSKHDELDHHLLIIKNIRNKKIHPLFKLLILMGL